MPLTVSVFHYHHHYHLLFIFRLVGFYAILDWKLTLMFRSDVLPSSSEWWNYFQIDAEANHVTHHF
jgi:hypothetical protein